MKNNKQSLKKAFFQSTLLATLCMALSFMVLGKPYVINYFITLSVITIGIPYWILIYAMVRLFFRWIQAL